MNPVIRSAAPDSPEEEPPQRSSHLKRVRGSIDSAIARISPESTREATLFERLTVRRLSWSAIRLLNRWLEITGKLTTGLWVVFIATVVLGVNRRRWRARSTRAGRCGGRSSWS